MSRIYSYVGASPLNRHENFDTARGPITDAGDALVGGQRAQPTKRASVVFTYIVDVKGLLWIADQRSEHVACARGGDVLSAGEMTVEVNSGSVCVTDITNQSTGYCPEPESWPAVAAALNQAGIQHPDGFTRAFLFRLCKGCGQTNIIKEGEFTCAVCGAELEPEWNFSNDTRQRTE